jgi:hypothetical protein
MILCANPAGNTANHITDKILRELEISKISQNPEKLIAQSYDGAAVMCGKLGGVQVKVRELYKHANFIHCYAHQLNLILQKAASQNKMIKKNFANLQAFSTFFSKSPKRTAVLCRRYTMLRTLAPTLDRTFETNTFDSWCDKCTGYTV